MHMWFELFVDLFLCRLQGQNTQIPNSIYIFSCVFFIYFGFEVEGNSPSLPKKAIELEKLRFNSKKVENKYNAHCVCVCVHDTIQLILRIETQFH